VAAEGTTATPASEAEAAASRVLRIAVDIGGTFTDVLGSDGSGFHAVKVPTTHGELVRGIAAGIEGLLERFGLGHDRIELFGHGTTIATNALLERRGGRVALVTTGGFRDVLELGTLKRPEAALYNLLYRKPEPLVARDLRLEVAERVGPDGSIVTPLDLASLDAVADTLAVGAEVDSVAVCCLFSFLEPLHERRIAERLRAVLPERPIYVSSEVLPVVREYPRLAYTVLCAYVGPVIQGYLQRLEQDLPLPEGARRYVMHSNAGLRSVSETLRDPASMILSGPAGGVAGAGLNARAAGIGDAISLDIGGTSTDVCLVADGRPLFTNEAVIDGIPIRTTMADIHTIGAGGGSLAWIDAGGGLHVGPQSAGSQPGPACYGNGGTRPTVTDADVVLGYLNPRALLDGAKEIYCEAAWASLQAEIGAPLDLDVVTAARGVLRLYVNAVQGALRVVSIERGVDPRDLALIAFGGAGPVHACEIAEDLGIGTVVIPRHPGLNSALGLLCADLRYESLSTLSCYLQGLDPGGLRETCARLQAEVVERLDRSEAERARLRFFFDLRYRGQSYTLPLELSPPELAGDDLAQRLLVAFEERHRTLYGFCQAAEGVFLESVRCIAESGLGVTQQPYVRETVAAAEVVERKVHFLAGETLSCPVLRRGVLAGAGSRAGPFVLEDYDTTCVVPPGWNAELDGYGQLICRHATARERHDG